MEWIEISLRWYAYIFFLGAVFFPLTKKIFGKYCIDDGYAFAKILGILVISYLSFIGGVIKLYAFSRETLFFLIFLSAGINIYLLKDSSNRKTNPPLFFIIFEELLFLCSLFLWIFIRGQEPSIRGLEKFMDFGFINSILRSQYFPPLDIWLAGKFINYYYFGHLTGAVLIRLSNIPASYGYNLILATIFALAITQVFSLIINFTFRFFIHAKKSFLSKLEIAKTVILGLLGTFIVNFAGNLHTVYLFTSGYPNEKPIPFWKIFGGYNPLKYWYPNATRFIPYTIHEFPIYSYVVADLHGHVFAIPIVLLTLLLLLVFWIRFANRPHPKNSNVFIPYLKVVSLPLSLIFYSVFLGFLTSIHYMTNAFDGPIYILLSICILFILFRFTFSFFLSSLILIVSFFIFSYPFSSNFSPFVSGIGINCSPAFLTNIRKIGPFLFEQGNCQSSPLWMMILLWGFFWINFILFILTLFKKRQSSISIKNLDYFVLILFSYSTFLIIIPEFFYIKDIYPAHFRANTMFKLGYQAFIMMGIASTYTFFQIKQLKIIKKLICIFIFLFFFFFISIYPFFAIPSYYGSLQKKVELDGSLWLKSTFPEDKEIIDFLNTKIKNQPVVLEAQGDSYTDYERISANTGCPTIAGWWVHEWLWRGSSDVVGKIIPDIVTIYESEDITLTIQLIRKYHVQYVVVSKMEREKYPHLYEEKFALIGKKIFSTKNGFGALYQVNMN